MNYFSRPTNKKNDFMVHLLNPLSHFVDMADRALKVGIVGYGHLGEFSNKNFCFKSHSKRTLIKFALKV